MAQIALAAIGSAQMIMQGIGAKGQADAQRSMYEQERKNAQIAAASDEAARRGKLQDILSSQRAILGARGLDPYDTQSLTIADKSKADAEADIGGAKMTFLNKAERYGQAAAYAKWQGKSALTGSIFGAGLNLLSGSIGQFSGGGVAGPNAAPGPGNPTAGV